MRFGATYGAVRDLVWKNSPHIRHSEPTLVRNPATLCRTNLNRFL
jgi:hypothetical protein